MDDTLFDLLRSVDTPTVCNAIEVAEGQRGFSRFTKATVLASDPTAGAMVGYAKTAKIAAKAPPSEAPDIVKARRMAYYKYMSEPPRPSVAVVEDTDFPNAVGGFWGEVNTTVHKGLGVAGALTNGVMRDLGDMAEGFPVLAGSIGPSHAHVHVTEIGCAVKIHGLEITEGDLVHADRHGAVVVPGAVIEHLAQAIQTVIDCEQLVLGPAREPGFDFERLQAAWSAFEKART